jgi:hypothetical protein
MTALPCACASALRRVFCLVVSFNSLWVAAAGLLSNAAPLQAQFARPGLVTEVVDSSDRVTLHGTLHPLATRAADRGLMPASTPANRMMLMLRRSSEQELALRAMIESLHDRSSPNFHKWLTPAQFGAQWGAADSDIAAVTAWLQSNGFQVKGPTAGRTAIEFSGTVGQVQQAFHAQIHLYQVNGELHHANASDPQIPAALAPVIAGISTLNDFHPRSMTRKGPRGIYDTNARKARPAFTTTGYSYLYVGPADAATIYDSPIKTLNPAATGRTVDGAGAKIGIVGDSNISTVQNVNYRQLFGLAPNPPTVIIDGDTDPGVNGDATEAYLDTEVAGGIAPGAQIYLYTAANTDLNYGLNLAAERAVNDNLVDVLSVSFTECEAQLGYSGNEFFNALWEQAAAQGISVTVATGDSGSAACDNPNYETEAMYGMQVNGLASTPFDIAVGGTDFAVLAGPDGSGQDFSQYVSENNTAGTQRSALGYIPEVPWNDTSLAYPPGPVSQTVPFSVSDDDIFASGGGKSNCLQGNGNSDGSLNCPGGYPKPSWQSGPGVPADQARDIPDVSLFASNGFNYAAWGICADQEADGSGNSITDCVPGADGLPGNEFYISGIGGTSASAPAFAGILALVNQSTGERQGQANYVLYNLAHTAGGVFHDVTTGNNSVPCQAGTANCSLNSAGFYYLTGYNAGIGYDLASGLGSVDVSRLIENWASKGLSSTATGLTLSQTTIQHGQAITANATVTSGGGTPAGDVALSMSADPPSLPAGSSLGTFPLTSAGSTGDVSLKSLPGGSYKIVATYDGARDFAQSSSAGVAITVTPEPSITALTLPAFNPMTQAQAPAGSVPYGYFINISANPYGSRSPVVGGVVKPDGIATGTVTFKDGSSVVETNQLDSNGFTAVNGYIFSSAGNHTISAAYSGDANFAPSVATKTVVVTRGATQLALSSKTTEYSGQPMVFAIHLSTTSMGAAPTGVVALVSGNTILAQANLTGVAGIGNTVASGSATVSYSKFKPDEDNIKAVYLGDANYAGSTSNAIAVADHLRATTTKLTVTPTVIQHGETATVNATVTGGSGTPAGFVILLASSNSTSFPVGNPTGMHTLSSGSTGSVSVSGLAGGSYRFTASYSGASGFSASTATPITLTVRPESSTTLVAVSSEYPSNGQASQSTPYGYPLSVNARAYGNHSPVAGGVVQPDGTATGSITFKDGSRVLSTDALTSNGIATTTGFLLRAGSHTISAVYSGDTSFDPSVGSEAITITKGVTQLTLASNTTKSSGKPIVFIANLTTASTGVAPTGKVALESGTTILAEANLEGAAGGSSALAKGSATITLSNVTADEGDVKAVYVGDGNYAGSTSNTIDLTGGQPAFVLASAEIELPGEYSTAAPEIITSSEGGYSGAIHYTCALMTAPSTVAPPECAMSPATETVAAGGTVSPEMLIFGSGTKLPDAVNLGSNARWLGAGGAVLACCLFFGIPARRCAWKSILPLVLLAISLNGLSACVKPAEKIASGQYTFKVTGTDAKDSTMTSTATVTVKVP